MRIDVAKYLFIGPKSQKKRFFEEAQNLGLIEFIDTDKKQNKRSPKELQRIEDSIRILRGLEVVEQEECDDFTKTEQLVNEILFLHESIERFKDDQRVYRQEIARVAPFGSFLNQDLQTLEDETGRKWRFFSAKQSQEVSESSHADLIYITSQHGLDYFVTFSSDDVSVSGLIEMHVTDPVDTLKDSLKKAGDEEHACEIKLKTFSKWNEFLHKARLVKLDEYNLATSQDLADLQLEGRIFAAQGFVAEESLEDLAALESSMEVHSEKIAIEEEDRVPTHLSNKGLAKIGEDLVHIYDTPSTEDKDPSMWVLFSFAFFFAIILGDGGYGVILLAIASSIHFMFRGKLEGLGKRVVKLTYILGSSCLVWGLLTHSFFGLSFELDSPMRSLSVLQNLTEQKAAYHISLKDDVWSEWIQSYPQLTYITDPFTFLVKGAKNVDGKTVYAIAEKFSDNILLELALLIGVIHITFSFLRNLRGSYAGIGWIIAMYGSYLYIPSMLNATSLFHFQFGIDKVQGAEIGYQLAFGGMGLAVLLGLVQHKLSGLAELMNVIQVFADVLSYLRLYALGLAGAMMSSTFNDIGASLTDNPMTFIAGILIIFIGHVVNFVLSIMGGVIHGLRLNFLEWYHYSFEGGGKLFLPLRLFKNR